MRALLAAGCRRRAARAAQRACAPATPAAPALAGIGGRIAPCCTKAVEAIASCCDRDAAPAGPTSWQRDARWTLLPHAAAAAVHHRVGGGCAAPRWAAPVVSHVRGYSAVGKARSAAGRARLNPNYAPHARALAPAAEAPAAPPQEAEEKAEVGPSPRPPPGPLRALPRAPPDADNAGWTHAEVVNVPNALSLGRAMSGPLIAAWVLQGHMDWALGALALAGASDWADGWLARRLGLQTVLGSYLDPLADKALTVCVLLALAAKGTLPAWLAAVAVGRDVALVSGALLSRAAELGWRWRGAREFFRMVPGRGEAAAPAAPPVEPLLVSKVNTALTFALVAAALAHDGWGVPDAEVLAAGAAAVGATTAMSGAAYLALFLRRRAGLPPP